MSYQILTRKNYDFFECSSAFQKSVRRGVERDAIFFGTELAGSGYAKYLWKRMLIISSEDIGLANVQISQQLQALYQNWQVIAEKNYEEAIIPIIHAILLLVRSPKSRLVDEAKMYALKSDYRPQVPDYALDTHTRRGKKMGRSLQFFLDEGSKLVEYVPSKIQDEFYSDFFAKYVRDYADKVVPITGYDSDNVYHKTTKDMQSHKSANNHLFNQ
jgi:replication-associated recombination protein RarA